MGQMRKRPARRGRTVAAALFVATAAIAAGCGGDDSGDGATATDAPATDAPATDAPATDAPATDAPATDAPATDAPTTAAPTTAAPTTTEAPEPIRILVTNDDGIEGIGMDLLVTALNELDGFEVTVVVPLEDKTGSGGSTTPGPLTATEDTTISGHPAFAVHGFPADTIVWAVDQGGLDFVPDLVVSGINHGQNFGPVAELSGTVGAARAAASRGIPALAVSQGIVITDDTVEPDYASGIAATLAWIEENFDAIEAHEPGDPVEAVVNMNIPTCQVGDNRGPLEVPHATELPQDVDPFGPIDCTSTLTNPANDVMAFLYGFVAIANAPIAPAA